MTSTDIYNILINKPHNQHYLQRYLKFITDCIISNSTKSEVDLGMTEKHHICPKAKSLFPEYKSLKLNRWNLAVLTRRQHIISHKILSKVYPSVHGIRFAALLMSSNKRTTMYLETRKLHKTNKSHICKWCGVEMKGGNFFKYHADNCKKNPNYKPITKICEYCGIEVDLANYGRSHGNNCKILCGVKKINYNRSKESLNKRSVAMKTRLITIKHKENMSASAKNRKTVKCPYCNKEGQNWIMTRWHFDKCKHNILEAIML